MMSARLSARVDDELSPDLFRGGETHRTRDDSPALAAVTGTRPSTVDAILRTLTPSDMTVIDTLAIVRMASGGQLNRLLWPRTPTGQRLARRHLARLTDLRVLARLGRRVGGVRSGSQGYTYSLDVIGQRIAQTHHTRTIRRPTPSDFFVDHTLAVTEVFVLFHEEMAVGGIESTRFVSEPDCWRTFVGHAGRTQTLRPDAFVEWPTEEWELRAFIEIDRATEHPGRIARKCEQYVRYWRTGVEQRESGVFPVIVWLAPSARREAVLSAVVLTLPADDQSLFRTTTVDELRNFIKNTSHERR